jgi:hypothetical protein
MYHSSSALQLPGYEQVCVIARLVQLIEYNRQHGLKCREGLKQQIHGIYPIQYGSGISPLQRRIVEIWSEFAELEAEPLDV